MPPLINPFLLLSQLAGKKTATATITITISWLVYLSGKTPAFWKLPMYNVDRAPAGL